MSAKNDDLLALNLAALDRLSNREADLQDELDDVKERLAMVSAEIARLEAGR